MTRRFLMALFLLFLFAASATAATIEFLDGRTLECKVLSKDTKTVTVETTMGGTTVKRTIPLITVHKVTINAKEYVINEQPSGGKTKATSKTAKTKTGSTSGKALSSGGKELRSKAAIDAFINEQGRTPPDWFEATPLDYPDSLDLSWPEPAPGGWNNQKNMGQYIWDIINPNENKWRDGVKLMHHLLTMHQDDPEKRTRIMLALGRMYHNLHQDYARAAFWWRQAGVEKSGTPPGVSVHLAECYWRLGNKQMAIDHLKKMRTMPYDAIKLYGDMGETEKAVQIANSGMRSARRPSQLYILIGDAYRVAGNDKKAMEAYQKAIDDAAKPDHEREEKLRVRAMANLDALKLTQAVDLNEIPDGAYRAQSLGYEGDIEVEVAVKAGRIEGVRVTQHKEKQYYSAIADTPAKIVARQGVKGVDSTSGATITSEAIINASAKALAKGAE